MQKITILGAGSWGTALGIVLADNGNDVCLWSHRKEQVAEINEQHTNQSYLPGVVLPDQIKAVAKLEVALAHSNTVILAVPTKAIRSVLTQAKPQLSRDVTIVHVSKGIEPGTLMRISEMIEDELSKELYKDIVVLSGPSHAEEVSKRQPTTVTVSSKSLPAAEMIQDLFINQHFRVYTNPDVIGVEIGGALKNIIALGAGISDGLQFGDNAKAALMTRGLAEISRLGTALGANPMTFAGLTGIGDLFVTCTSTHSRNWRAGHLLGQGKSLDEVLGSMGMVVEGVPTTQAAFQLAKREQIDMPITTAIHDVLFNHCPVSDAVEELMGRVRRHEMEDLVNISNEKRTS